MKISTLLRLLRCSIWVLLKSKLVNVNNFVFQYCFKIYSFGYSIDQFAHSICPMKLIQWNHNTFWCSFIIVCALMSLSPYDLWFITPNINLLMTLSFLEEGLRCESWRLWNWRIYYRNLWLLFALCENWNQFLSHFVNVWYGHSNYDWLNKQRSVNECFFYFAQP